jgi:hypothetical protein
MLKIFEQIFRSEAKSAQGYSDELIKRATERALDATDPRVRILSAYAKQMRAAVINAIDHVVQLIDALSEPLPMSRADWNGQALLSIFFASGDSLHNMVSGDTACKDFAAANAPITEPVIALLLAKNSRKNTYGYDLIDGKSMSDVPLTVVSFDEHRLLGLATNEAETRRLLKLRTFDYLLMLALQKITDVKEQRQDLISRKKLLKAKLDILGRSSGNLLEETRLADKETLQKKMDMVEAELNDVGADDTVLQRHLEIIIETLATADKQLWLEQQTLYIDNMHYLRAADHPKAAALPLQILHDANAHERAVQLVRLSPANFLPH